MFGNDCERILCKFRHEEHHPDEEDRDDVDSDEDQDENDNEKDEINYINTVHIKDLEPILRKVEEAIEKVNELPKKKSDNLTCDECEFEAKNVNGLNMHKKAKHAK